MGVAREGRRAAVVALVMAAVVAVAGCGGEGSARLTRSEWIAQADEVCAQLAEELQAIPEPQTPEEVGEAGARVVEISSRRVAELRELPAPSGDEAAIQEMLGAFEDVIELSGELTEAMAAQDDSKAAELFPELGERSQEAEQLASDYGLAVCGAADE